MIKKLNKHKGFRNRPMWVYYHDKDTDDLSRVSYQAWEIYFILKDLHERIWLHSLRLKHSLLYEHTRKLKAELKLQQRIVDEHLNQIRLLLKDNEKLKNETFEKRIAEDELKIVK